MSTPTAMNLTQGRPARQILLFALPLVVGSLFQQLYSFVDTVMVGRFLGENALAAVGTTYSLHFLILGFVQGTCVGFGIPLAKAVGARDKGEFQRYFWNGVWLCLIVGLVLTSVTAALAVPLLRLIATPAEILPQAACYIRIIFLGIPATILYNFCAGVLRASGDSRRPTYFLLLSSLLNIGLDYMLLIPIPLGVAGAALATVLSQLVSGLLNLFWILRKTHLLQDPVPQKAPSAAHLATLSRVGLPMGFEYSLSAIGAVILQGAVNDLGTAAIAGQTAGEKIRQLFTLPMESVGMAMATYAGQNDGAKAYGRIRSGIRGGLCIQLCYCALSWCLLFFGKVPLCRLVLGTCQGEAAGLCIRYLSCISTLFCLHGSLMILRNTLQGMGYSLHAVLSGVFELLGRGLGSWLALGYWGFFGICFANPLAWCFALCYCTTLVCHFLRQRENNRQVSGKNT